MLKRQKELNALEGIGKGPLANSEENNNASAQFNEDLNLSNKLRKRQPRRFSNHSSNNSINNNFINNNSINGIANTKEDYNCTKYDQK